jgi:hypothetical protein
MKKVQWALLLVHLTTFTLAAYSQPANTWKEMEGFHTVMSTTFHPAEENNLQPLKEKAAALLAAAKAWKKSTVPQGYNAALTKPVLKRLVKQCSLINTAVNNKRPDAELKILVTEAHEIFHELKEKCKKTGTD